MHDEFPSVKETNAPDLVVQSLPRGFWERPFPPLTPRDARHLARPERRTSSSALLTTLTPWRAAAAEGGRL